jgi:hypothetical protein
MNFWDTLKSELLPEAEPVSVPEVVPANVPVPIKSPESTATTKMDHAIMERDVPEPTAEFPIVTVTVTATATATATVTAAATSATTVPAQDFPQRRRRV